MNAFFGLVRKEVYHILRDRRTLAVLLLMPVLQVLIFGFAIRTDVEDVRLAIVDPSPEAATHELRAKLDASDRFRVEHVGRSTDGLDALFQTGTIDQALVLESKFTSALHEDAVAQPTTVSSASVGAQALLLTDAINPNIGRIRQDYAHAVIQDYERSLTRETRRPPFRVETRVRYNPTLQSAYFFVPGLLAFVLTIVSALMTALSLAREKETGTMETMLVSPLRPWQVIGGKVAPYVILAFVNVVTVLGIAYVVFDVPIRGHLGLLFGLSLLFVTVSLALGVFISTRTDSQRTAMMGTLLALLLPTTLLSGMIFPIQSMPGWLQPVSHLVPAKWFLHVVRGVLLKGVGLEVLWSDALILLTMGTLFLGASLVGFDVRLE